MVDGVFVDCLLGAGGIGMGGISFWSCGVIVIVNVEGWRMNGWYVPSSRDIFNPVSRAVVFPCRVVEYVHEDMALWCGDVYWMDIGGR